MSTPQQQPTKGPRRSGKKPRQPDNQEASLPTSAIRHQNPSPPAANNTKNNNKGQPRRASHAHNKNLTDGNISDRGKHNKVHPEKAKATPVKQAAYAGATFQQSPAASALPLPSFYSKSLPTASFIPSQPANEPSPPPPPASVTPPSESPSNRESTPCDFLFEAARQAKATPRGQSPAAHSGNLSVPTGSPASRSPGPREGDPMFPFELDGGAFPGEDGSSFATPYKDRMAALRSTRSTSQGAKSMDEIERKAKTEALKKLLMKSSGQEGSQIPNGQPDVNNPFNARPPLQAAFSPKGTTMNRPSSNPSTPVYYMQERKEHQSPHAFPHQPYNYSSGPLQTPKRPTSSSLRHVYGAQSEPEFAELSSDNAVTPPFSTARKSSAQAFPQYGGFLGQPYSPQPQMPTHQAKPSAQQLEDDLRRVLKLDLTSRG